MNTLEKIISSVFNVPIQLIIDEATPEAIANWNSMNHINLILVLEEEFGVTFTSQEISSIKKIADFRNYLKEKGVAA